MAAYPFQWLNRRGIPIVESAAVAVNTDNVVFRFQNHAFANMWYRGLVLINLAQAIPAGTTGTLPILFETNGVTIPLTSLGGEAVTAADITGTGVIQLYYDRTTNVLQVVGGASA